MLFSFSAHAEQKTDGLNYEWLSAAFVKSEVSSPDAALLAVTYKLTNHSKTRKVALGAKPFAYRLTDEHGNHYNQQSVPEGFVKPSVIQSAHHPSFYPGDVYQETVFFERPVRESRSLTLHLEQADAQLEGATLMFHRADIEGVRRVDPEHLWREGVRILQPSGNHVASQGSTVMVEVLVDEGIPLERLLLVGFEQTFTDEHPATRNLYELNIPDDFPPGNANISVVASFEDEESDKIYSDSVMFEVRPVVRAILKPMESEKLFSLDEISAR